MNKKYFFNFMKAASLVVSFATCASSPLFCADSTTLTTQKINMQNIIQDSNLTVKTLPNGFSIYFYKNSEPPKRVSMRLVVKRGSSTEKDSQRGLAHFIEHMAFNGTKNFPSGSMVEYFQRLGMAFGADTNAHTSFNETVYKIDMPSNEESLVADGFKLFRDYADGMLLESSAIERERGVIIAEKKSRDTASYRTVVARFSNLFKGSAYEDRMPIGLEEVIKTATRSEFVDFYKSNYRPENMAIVIVGDADADFILAQAQKYFEDLKGDENFPNSVPPQAKFSSSPSGEIFAFRSLEKGLKSASASRHFVMGLFDEKDSIKKRALDLQCQVLAQLITMRFNARKTDKDTAYIGADADLWNFENHANIFSISAVSNIGSSMKAMENVEQMWTSLLKFGVADWELEKAKREILNELESAMKAEKTRKTAGLSNLIASAVRCGDIITSAQFDLDFAREVLSDFDAQKVFALINFIEKNSKKFAQFVDENLECGASENANSDFAKIREKIEKTGVRDLRLSQAELVFSNFGGQGKIIKDESKILGIREIAFQNGVRLNLKKTDFTKEEIIINVSFGGGRFDTPKNNPALAEICAGFLYGGTAFQSFDEINLAKADKQISLGFSNSKSSFDLSATCTPKSFDETVKLLATYLKDPAFSDSAMPQLEKMINLKYQQLKTQPEAAFPRVNAWICSENYMIKIPEYEDVKKCDMRGLKEWLLPIVKNSYMEISIVGDFDEAQALTAVSETFGAFEKREDVRKNYDEQRKICMTCEREKVFYIDNPNDARARVFGIMPTCSGAEIKQMRVCNVLSAVLDDELRKSIREDTGKVYSPFAVNSSSQTFNYGLMLAGSDVVPEFADEVLALIKNAFEKISKNITEDEFERAKIPILKQNEKARRTNSYWAYSAMPFIQADSQRRETALTYVSGYEEVSLQDVKDACKKFIEGGDFYSVKILPKKSD